MSWLLLLSFHSIVFAKNHDTVYYVGQINISIALLQMSYGNSITSIENFLMNASHNNSDIAIFPSGYLNGSCSKWISTTRNWCLNYNMAISISCEYNSTVEALVMDRNGNVLLTYTKPARNGQDPQTSSAILQLSNNNIITIGILLEDDIFYPEIARDLMLKGVHLVIFQTKGNLTSSIDDILLYSRGAENLNIIARVNRASSQITNNIDNGRSAVGSNIGGIYSPNGLFITSPVNNQPQVIISKFNIDYINNARTFNHMGDNFRRPFHYKSLCNLSTINNNKQTSNGINNKYAKDGGDILVKVAALQMVPGQSVQDNIKIGDNFVRKAKEMGADIAFMPEMFSVGYLQIWPKYIYDNMTSLTKVYKWLDLSQTKYEEYVTHFKNLSIELSIAIGVSFLEKNQYNINEIPPYNSIILFDQTGNELYTYSKVHTVGDDYNEALTSPGWSWYVNQLYLDKNRGNITIGSMICYDQEFPETTRILNQLNVELLLKSNACKFDKGAHWRLRSRAIENKIGIMMSNYAYPTIGVNGNLMNGNSCGYMPNGDILIIANQSEQVVMTTFNITEIREQRLNLKPIHQIERLCDFQRQPDFTMHNDYFRVSGCTV